MKPTKPGYYWWRYSEVSGPSVLKVIRHDGELVAGFTGSLPQYDLLPTIEAIEGEWGPEVDEWED